MRVLVTGGAGFIGSHVVEELLKVGHSVCVVDDLSTGRREHVPDKCKLYQVDVASAEFLQAVATEKPQAIVHLAAQISVSASMHNPEEDARVNIWGALNLLRAAHAHNVKRVVFSSSAAVYGNPAKLPLTENSHLNPLSPYGVSKRAAEDYLRIDAANTDLEVAVLRFGNVYGPRQAVSSECGVITIFVQALLEGRSPTIFGDGNATRDYVYVSDVAKAVKMALGSQNSFTANISSGKEVTVQELWALLLEISGMNITPHYGPERPGDIVRSCLDPSAALKLLGWRSSTSLHQGLQETLDFYGQLRGAQ